MITLLHNLTNTIERTLLTDFPSTAQRTAHMGDSFVRACSFRLENALDLSIFGHRNTRP
jgi:hypothetical protein